MDRLERMTAATETVASLRARIAEIEQQIQDLSAELWVKRADLVDALGELRDATSAAMDEEKEKDR